MPDHDRKQARRHPDRDTLELATAGAARCTSRIHGVLTVML